MSELYIFSQDDELLTIITEETGLDSAPFRDEINGVANEPFIFTVDAEIERAKFVKEENRVVFRDREGDFREFVIKELDDINNIEGPQTAATCKPAWLDELSENYVLDKRYNDKEAQLALDDALVGTRYIGEVHASLGLASTNFYRISSVDCIWKIIDVWGGDFKDVVVINDEGRIGERKIQLLQRRGADNGARFEIDHNIEEIQRTVLSYPKTAMYGWGASLETEGGGNSRYIDFGDIEWKKSKGDPVDKPLGQKWVGDPDALLKYGRKHEGNLLHRFGEFSNQNYETPEDLLMATWLNLQENNEPVVNYQLSVDMLDKDANLGDTAIAIDREFARPIEIQTRVIAIEYDLLDMDDAKLEMGSFLDLGENDVYRDIEDLKEQVNKPQPPINDNSFPDIKPSIPKNVKAEGLFKSIVINWDYDNKVYISHYEVYGSRVKGYTPGNQHLLCRGDVSSFVHEAETDETWYYYVRAVNTRGTASDFSAQVSASTVRIKTPDMMHGSVTADLLANNLEIAEKLSDGTFKEISDKIKIEGDIHIIEGTAIIQNGVVGTLAVADAAIVRAHLQDAIIGEAQIDDLVITNRMISPNAEIDFAKIANVEIVNAMIKERLQANKIIVGPDTTFDDGYDPTKIEVGAVNLITHLSSNWEQGGIYTNGNYFLSNGNIRQVLFEEIKPNTKYTLTSYGEFIISTRIYDDDKNIIQGAQSNASPNDSVTFTTPSNARYFKVYIREYEGGKDINPDMIGANIKGQLEKGNKSTDWSLNPSDIEELTEEAKADAKAVQQAINANKAIWDRASFLNANGTLNVDKLSGTLTDEQIKSAQKWNGQGTFIDENGVYTGALIAGQIQSGRFDSEFVTIGPKTKFESDEYDPTKMEVGGQNLLIQSDFLQNTALVQATGEETTVNNANTSDFIEVGDNKKITVSRKIGTTNSVNNNLQFDFFRIIFYNNNKNYIDGVQWNGTSPPRTVDIPDNAAFVRFSSSRADLYNLKAEFGRLATSWNLAPEDVQAGVEVGGSNLIYYTTPNDDNASRWISIGSYTDSLTTETVEGEKYFYMPINASVETGQNPRFRSSYVTHLRHGQTYTASWKAFHSNYVSDEAYGGIYNDSGIIVQSFKDAKREVVRTFTKGGFTRTEYQYTFTFTLDYPTAPDRTFGLYLGANYTRENPLAAWVYFRDIMFEEGTKATSWSPNPEDYEAFAKNYADGVGDDAKKHANNVGTNIRGDLRLTAPLPNSIAMNANGITATASGSSKYARLDNRGLFIKGGAIQIERPDGAAWMEDGMVRQDYAISGFDPYDMDYVRMSGTYIDGVFRAFRGFYRAGYQAIRGGGDYDDIRDSSKRYTVKYTTYEFIHTARYLIIGYRKAVNSDNPKHRVAVYDGSTQLYFEEHSRGGSPSYAPITIDLGKPNYLRKRLELRIGVLNADVSGTDTIAFRVNRVFQTDFL